MLKNKLIKSLNLNQEINFSISFNRLTKSKNKTCCNVLVYAIFLSCSTGLSLHSFFLESKESSD